MSAFAYPSAWALSGLVAVEEAIQHSDSSEGKIVDSALRTAQALGVPLVVRMCSNFCLALIAWLASGQRGSLAKRCGLRDAGTLRTCACPVFRASAHVMRRVGLLSRACPRCKVGPSPGDALEA